MFNKKEELSRPVETVQDPITGETIHRVAVDIELIKNIDKQIQIHGGTMNEFVMNSNNYFSILKRQFELLDKIKKADDDVKAKMNEAMKKSKLDPKLPWAYNMVLKQFEYRTPPIVPGMSEAEIKATEQPGRKPEIINQTGIAS